MCTDWGFDLGSTQAQGTLHATRRKNHVIIRATLDHLDTMSAMLRRLQDGVLTLLKWVLAISRVFLCGMSFVQSTSAFTHSRVSNPLACKACCRTGTLSHRGSRCCMCAAHLDWCSASVAHLSCETQYGQMSQALNATGRPIAFYMSCGPEGRAQSWARDVANVWRIGKDTTSRQALLGADGC